MLKTQVRVKGYVVGYDVGNGELLWTVKVKDPKSIHNGKKFVVHSCQVGTLLSRPSVDVSFRVDPVQVGQEHILKAVDVAFAGCKAPDTVPRLYAEGKETLHIAVVRNDGVLDAYFVGYENADEARETFEPEGEELIAFFPVSSETEELDEDQRAGFRVVAALSYVDGTRDALEFLLKRLIANLNVTIPANGG